MPQPIEELKRVRIEKLEKLRDLGIDPYPASWKFFDSRISNQELREKDLGSEVVAVGRIRATRGHGGIVFVDIYDESGKIQVCFREDGFNPQGPWEFNNLNLLDLGDFIGVRGELFKTEAGELTILVEDLKLLSKTIRPLPSEWYGLKDKEERYRKRYLDLIMNPEVREVFRKRTKILTLLRKYLDNHGFMEVETPILQPIYGGASARPFVTHLEALDTDFYLRISNELYLKRLVVGGFEKVYEVSKDFRNEGIDRQHSPEFTQIEFYWAYADYEDLMDFIEEMLCSVIEEICGSLEVEFGEEKLDFTSPWNRITYRDLVLEQTGIDIDKVTTEKALLSELKEKDLSIDLEGAVGYGAVLDNLYKEYCQPTLVQPTFLIEHPAELMPLAKRMSDDPSKIQSVQLLVSGYELIKAYSELNDPQDQRERWEEQEGLAAKGLEEHEALDEDYIEALEYGMPPTAGWGMGIDRLTAILTNQPSIRDVILFPLMRPEK
ncbi:MAG: lysine--tRNA ligase [Patescibacteria group bacterium]|nr:lysine--tRNA ligase [Patescibacteria group bacterium]